MHPRYPRIFSTIKLGPIEVPNRFYSSPHICPLTTHTGAPSEDFIAYYMARVKGGCGLVILSMAAHDRSRYIGPSPYSEETIPEWRILTDSVHAENSRIFGQLWYWWENFGSVVAPQYAGTGAHAFRGAIQSLRKKGRHTRNDEARDSRDARYIPAISGKPSWRRVRRHHASCVPWLPHEQIPITLFQPPHGRIRRESRKPDAALDGVIARDT